MNANSVRSIKTGYATNEQPITMPALTKTGIILHYRINSIHHLGVREDPLYKI
jgi:hypothetical protein